MTDDYRKALPATVIAPTIIPGATNFAGTLIVRLLPTPSPQGRPCVVRYTLDGSDPTPRSAVYVRPLVITNTVTLKAAAFVTGKPRNGQSETVVATFKAGERKRSLAGESSR